jgi:hypothetical protein
MSALTWQYPIDRYHFELMESITAENGVTMAHPFFDAKVPL